MVLLRKVQRGIGALRFIETEVFLRQVEWV